MREPRVGHERVNSNVLFGETVAFVGIALRSMSDREEDKIISSPSLPTLSIETIIGDVPHSLSSLKSDLQSVSSVR